MRGGGVTFPYKPLRKECLLSEPSPTLRKKGPRTKRKGSDEGVKISPIVLKVLDTEHSSKQNDIKGIWGKKKIHLRPGGGGGGQEESKGIWCTSKANKKKRNVCYSCTRKLNYHNGKVAVSLRFPEGHPTQCLK